MDASENSSRPTMDQLEAESGLTWDDALSRLKDLEKTLKYQIQCDIREMKLCMTSNKIEDVSLKASRLHDIRRTLASSRALVREECAIMKEFEKIKGILGESRTMDEDDWSSTKNKTKYWGEQLANVRRRQRRISGDVEDLDSVVSEIMTRRDMENDSVDSLDNLSFHLTNYPLFNNAPYGHHLSVPSRPGSAMSDVSAVSTGIAGYFKGRDTTDMSQSETEQSVTPQMQKKKLFTKTTAKDPSLDGSEFEEGHSMQEMYMKEKRKSAMEFKKKALLQKDANVKAIEDHETGMTSEYEGYYDDEHDTAWDVKQQDEDEQQQWQIVDKQELLTKKQEEEEKMMEALRLKEEEAENKRIQEENAKKQKEAQRLKEQVEERKRIEAEEKKKKLEENKKKLEEKKAKEEEKKKKLDEKKKKLDEKKRKEDLKKKKSEDKLRQDEEGKKGEDEIKISEQQQKDKLSQENKEKEENESINQTTKKVAKSRSQSREKKSDQISEGEGVIVDEENMTNQNQLTKKATDDSKLEGNQDTKKSKTIAKSRSQSRDTKSDHVGEEEEKAALQDNSQSTKAKGKQEANKTKPIAKSRSQSREKKSAHVEENATVQGQTQAKDESKLKGKQDLNKAKTVAKSRSQSREKKSDHPKQEEGVFDDEENATTQGQTKTTKKAKDESKLKGKQDLKTSKTAAKSRSQSREKKSDHVDGQEGAFVDEKNATLQNQTPSVKDESKETKKTKTVAKSRSQSRENKSGQIRQEDASIDSNQNYEKEGEPTNKHKSKLEEHQKTAKAAAKSRSQSRENKMDEIQSKEMIQCQDMKETSVKSSQKGQKVDDKVGKLSKSRSQSRESKPNELDNEEILLEPNKMEDDAATIQQMKPKRTKGAKTKTGAEDESIKSCEKGQDYTIEESEIDAQTKADAPQMKPQRKKGLKAKSAEESKSSETDGYDASMDMVDEKSFMNQEEELQIGSHSKKLIKSRSQSRERKEIQNRMGQPLDESEDDKAELNQMKPQRTNRKNKSKQPDEKIKSRSVSRERKDQFCNEQEEDESNMIQTLDNEDAFTHEGKKKITSKSRSQSRENKHDLEDHEDGSLIKDVHEPIAKPKRSKNKQLAKQSSIANDDAPSSEHKTEEQFVQMNLDQIDPDEIDSIDVSTNLAGREKMTNQRSRSHSRDKRELHAVETENIEFPHSQSISSIKNDMAAPEEVTKEEDSSHIVKPKRTKGKGKKQLPEAAENKPRSLSRERKSLNQSVNQTECFDESGPDGQFTETFKQESPEYAEIDYEQDHILAKGDKTQFQVGKSMTPRSASKERKKIELNEEYTDQIQHEAEPIYAKVQKKGSRDASLSRDGAKSPKTASADSKEAYDEPMYAEVGKKMTRSASGERRHGSNMEMDKEENSNVLYSNTESGKKKSQTSSRQASRERKEMTLQQDSYSDEGIPFEMDRQFPSSEQNEDGEFYDFTEDKDSSRKMFIDGKYEGDNNEIGLDLSLTQDPEEDFWGSEDQMEVSSTGLPDIATIKKPARRSHKKSHDEWNNETLEKKEKPPRKAKKGLASDPALQKYLDQNKSLNLSDNYPFESQDTDESAEAPKDFGMQQLKRSHMRKDDSLDYDEYEEANEYFAGPHETGIGTEGIEKDREYLTAHQSTNLFHYSPSNQGQVEAHEEIERPLSALGQYSGGEDTSPYPEDSDELMSYRESGLVREKPDGMDRDELRQFDPNHFQQKRTRAKDIKRERLAGGEEFQGSSFEDEEYFQNFGQKPEEANAKIGTVEPLSKASINQVSSGGRNTSRERPNNLDLKDIKPRVGDKQKSGFFKDEALIDEMDLQNSLGQMWKKPGRRRRTVSHTFESEVDEYDDEEFDSDAKNYSMPPLLQPPPRKNRSRSGSVSPLPKEKENIGPKLERMFSTDQDNNVLEFEYDDNGVKKIKKVSFATENEQFVLRPDPEVRSIPGTKLFSFAPSKTHEQPLDLRQRGRQKKKSAQKKRSSSADIFPTWSKNSALNFLKSMTNFTGSYGGRSQEEDMDLVDEQMGLDPYKFDEAFANASSSEKFFPDEKVIDHKFINNEQNKTQHSTSLNEYIDNAINEAISPKKCTTQSLDNVNLRNNYMDRNLPDRPCSTEPISAVGATYQNPDKKQSSIFGNIISRAKSLSRNNSRQNSEERSIFKNLFQPKSSSKIGGSSGSGSSHKRSLSFDGFGRKISGGSNSTKGAGEPSIISTEENYNDGAETEFLTESESSFMNRLKMKKLPKNSVNKTDFDQLFARGLALSAEKEKEMMKQMETQMTPHSPTMLDHRPTTPFEVFSKDEVFKKSQQGAGISFEEKVKYFLDDLSHQPHTSTFQAPMNCSPVAAAAAVAAMAPPRSTIAQGNKSRGGFIPNEQPPKPGPKESPHQFLRRAEEFVKLAEVDTEYSQPVWPAIIQSPDDLPPPKTANSNVNAALKSPMYPNFSQLTPAANINKSPPSPKPAPENTLKKPSIPAEVSQALAPMMAYMMEMKKSSKSPELRTSGETPQKLKEFGTNLLQRSASSSDPFPGSYKTDLGRAEYGTLTRKDSTNFKGRASSVSSRIPLRDNSLDRVHKLRRSTSRDTEINHRRRSQEPLILDHTRCDSRMSNYSADVPDLEDADISNAMMLKSNLNTNKDNIAGSKASGNDHEFLSPSSSILQKKEKVLDEMTKEKLALQEAKSWFQTILMIILCICAIIFIQSERRT